MEHKPILFKYQQRWVKDPNRLKIAVKSTQIGYSFGESYADVVRCIERPNYLRAILSKSEKQALEFARKCADHCKAIGAVAQLTENQSFEGTSMLEHRIEFPNRSRIIVLTSNADTARGYSCDITLDEFAFHRDQKKVYAAAYGRTTRGYDLAIISTPFGEAGEFYAIAKKLGLAEGVAPAKQPVRVGEWSGHWCDIYQAVREGLTNVDGSPLDPEKVLAGIDDPDSRDQEYLCKFLSDAMSWVAWEEIVRATTVDSAVINIERDGDLNVAIEEIRAAMARYPLPPGAVPFLGGDIARKRDLTIYWPIYAFMSLGVNVTPFVVRIRARKFKEQRKIAELLMDELEPRRLCQDATGLGMQLAEELGERYGAARVEPVNFTFETKEDLAVRTRRRFEDSAIKIPDDKNIKAGIHAVKKFPTAAGHFRFDAARTDAGHADEFWALALAFMAAEGAPAVAMASSDGEWMPRQRANPSREVSADREQLDVRIRDRERRAW